MSGNNGKKSDFARHKVIVLGLVLLVPALIVLGCAKAAPTAPSTPASTSKSATTAPPASSSTSKPASTPASTTTTQTTAKAFTATFKTHSFFPATHGTVKLYTWWTDEVTKRTEGRVKFQHFYQEALVKQGDELNAMKAGVFDLGIIGSGLAAQLPLSEVNWLASYPTNSVAVAAKSWIELWQLPAFKQEWGKWNVKPLFWSNSSGARNLLSKKAVRKYEDLKGLRIRVGSKPIAEAFQRAGASPSFITSAEIYDAMQKGTLDANEGALALQYTNKLYEVAKYYTTINVGFGGVTFGIRANLWDSLPPDVQKVMIDVTNEQPAELDRFVDADNKVKWKGMLDAGVTVIQFPKEEQDKFEKDTLPTIEQWKAAAGPSGQEIYDTFVKTIKKYEK